MLISQNGIDLIKSFESFRAKTYVCPAGKKTIGWGHTGADVKDGMTVSKEQAEELLRKDLISAETAVVELIDRPLTQNQFDALVSFVFNIGRPKFSKSTLRKLLNSGDVKKAALEFDKWIYSNGKILNGLVTRRTREKALFLK